VDVTFVDIYVIYIVYLLVTVIFCYNCC